MVHACSYAGAAELLAAVKSLMLLPETQQEEPALVRLLVEHDGDIKKCTRVILKTEGTPKGIRSTAILSALRILAPTMVFDEHAQKADLFELLIQHTEAQLAKYKRKLEEQTAAPNSKLLAALEPLPGVQPLRAKVPEKANVLVINVHKISKSFSGFASAPSTMAADSWDNVGFEVALQARGFRALYSEPVVVQECGRVQDY